MILEKLIQLEKKLSGLEIKSLNYLQPGISSELIESQLGKLYPSIGSDPIIKELYSWHNGSRINYTEAAVTFNITSLFFPNSIEEIKEIVEAGDDIREFKSRNHIPLFSTGHGEFLSVNASELLHEPGTAMLYYVSTWNPEFELYTPMFDSIFSFLDTTIECLNSGIYYKNEDGVLGFDFEKEREIAKKLNKTATMYWTEA
jgi:hypothetical protein